MTVGSEATIRTRVVSGLHPFVEVFVRRNRDRTEKVSVKQNLFFLESENCISPKMCLANIFFRRDFVSREKTTALD